MTAPSSIISTRKAMRCRRTTLVRDLAEFRSLDMGGDVDEWPKPDATHGRGWAGKDADVVEGAEDK